MGKSGFVFKYICKPPFGMLMPGRTYTSEAYRYGFNGKENDDEISGGGNNLDFGARIYDSRLGRWLSLDPNSSDYISFSTFCYALNSPLHLGDPNGKWVTVKTTKYFNKNGKPIEKTKWYHVFRRTSEIVKEITVGDVKFLSLESNVEEGLDVKKPLTPEEQSQIIIVYKHELENLFNDVINANRRKKLVVTLSFANEPIFINNTSQVSETDELVVIDPSTTGYQTPGSYEFTHGYTTAVDPSIMVLNLESALEYDGTKPHEFMHQRSSADGNTDHRTGGVFKDIKMNKENFRNLRIPSSGVDKNTNLFKRIQKLDTKLENNSNLIINSGSPGSGMGGIHLDQLDNIKVN